jgi:predicted membrane channel-forming protein YqfA (hemolysin III family)
VSLGRSLLVFGLVLAVVGILLELAPALRLGRLPGDVSFGGTSWRVYVPLGTSLLLSVVLTLVFALVGALARR